jgi:hypothetical protein
MPASRKSPNHFYWCPSDSKELDGANFPPLLLSLPKVFFGAALQTAKYKVRHNKLGLYPKIKTCKKYMN